MEWFKNDDLVPEDIGDLVPDNKYAHSQDCDCLECIVIPRGTNDGGPR